MAPRSAIPGHFAEHTKPYLCKVSSANVCLDDGKHSHGWWGWHWSNLSANCLLAALSLQALLWTGWQRDCKGNLNSARDVKGCSMWPQYS